MEIACLGSRTLQPHRQLLAGGERVALGKRALEVISRLAEARGEIVTKDELLEAVWPGTIVEENALQAQVTALRKALGPEADRLKTIRGVGYRLNLDPCAATATLPETQPPPRFGRSAPGRWSPARLAGLVAIAIALAGGTWTALNVRTNLGDMVRVQTLSASGGAQAQLLAQSLDGEIVNVLNRSGIETRGDDAAKRFSLLPQSDWRFGGSVLQNGSHLTVDVRFEDVPSGTVLWSRRFEGDLRSGDALVTEASVAVARTIYTAQELKLQKSIEVDPVTVALHLRASELVRSRQLGAEGTPRQIYERIVARQPRVAHAHGMLALTMILDAREGPPAVRAELGQAIRREAAKAIEIDPAGAGPAYDALQALSRLERPQDYAAAERWLLEGLRSAPGFAFLWMRECRLLMEVGRAQDAMSYCRRGLAKHPYAEPIGHSYAVALWASGDYTSAADAIAQAATLAPDHEVTRNIRFELAAFGGNENQALKLLDDPATRPWSLQPNGLEVLQRYLTGDELNPGERDRLATELQQVGRSRDIPIEWAVMALTTLGQRDRAFDLLDSFEVGELTRRGSGFLFKPPTRPLRADPRFFAVAARLGIARYWASSGKWPDMCGEEYEAEYCKAQVRTALGRT